MSTIDTFRRAMRRYERRARRMGLGATCEHIRSLRLDPHPDHARDIANLASFLREAGRSDEHMGPRIAFLFDLAADAVARLRDGLRREQKQAEAEAYVYVCPECYCVGPEPHAPGCDEEARARRAEVGSDEEDDARDVWEDDP